MLLVRAISLAFVVGVATAKGVPSAIPSGAPRFCLELLRGQDQQGTTKVLLTCVLQIRDEDVRQGRQFSLDSDTYDRVGRCIAEQVGVVDAAGRVNKTVMERRILTSRQINEQQRTFYMNLLPSCNDWDSCIKPQCRIQ